MRRSGSILFMLATLFGLGLGYCRPGAAADAPEEAGLVDVTQIAADNHGEAAVVGWVTFNGNASGLTPAIWLSGTASRTLLPGNPFGEATSVNSKGTVTGTLLINQAPQAYCWSQSKGLEMLGPGLALFVNESDEAFGAAPHNGTYEAVKWVNGCPAPMFLGLGGGVASQVDTGDIYGNVAGTGRNADGTTFGFEIANGKYTKLAGLGGSNVSVYRMNNRGIVVGAATLADGTSQAVYWDAAGGVHNLKVPGFSAALAAADNGVAVVNESDGLHLIDMSTPGVTGPPLEIFPTPEFLGIGPPVHSGISQLGNVSGVTIRNGNEYHGAISNPQSTPLPAAAITSLSAAVQSASDLVTKLQKSLPAGTSPPTASWLDLKARLYASINQRLPSQRGQTSMSAQQTGEVIYALSNSLANDTRGGPNGAPDASIVSADQLQQLTGFDTQALKAAGQDPNAVPSF